MPKVAMERIHARDEMVQRMAVLLEISCDMYESDAIGYQNNHPDCVIDEHTDAHKQLDADEYSITIRLQAKHVIIPFHQWKTSPRYVSKLVSEVQCMCISFVTKLRARMGFWGC